MKKTHDAVATIREYTDPHTGEKKKHRVNVGALFTDDQGRLSFKQELIPTSPDWSGWINFYEIDRDRDTSRDRQTTRPAKRPPAPKPKIAADDEPIDDMEADDIPF